VKVTFESTGHPTRPLALTIDLRCRANGEILRFVVHVFLPYPLMQVDFENVSALVCQQWSD